MKINVRDVELKVTFGNKNPNGTYQWIKRERIDRGWKEIEDGPNPNREDSST
jgi:hypothetical protein